MSALTDSDKKGLRPEPPAFVFVIMAQIGNGIQLCGVHPTREQAKIFADRLSPRCQIYKYCKDEYKSFDNE